MSNEVFGIIYKATFPNGKCYVGQTIKELEHRKKQHIYCLDRENLAFHNAIKKYGAECIVWEVIDTAENIEDLNAKEVAWIAFHKSYAHAAESNGYNLTLGGGGGSAGRLISSETRAKMRAAQLGRTYGEETRAKVSRAGKGRKRSEETRAKMRKPKAKGFGEKVSAVHLGRKRSPETCERIGNSKRGTILSDDHKAKLSEALKGDKTPCAKLTWEQVREIRSRYIPRTITLKQLAAEYGISFSNIHRIVKNQIWVEPVTDKENHV
jgi:group I intron endonuclease